MASLAGVSELTVPETTPVPPDRARVHAQLVASRIAGQVATTRENNLANYRRMSDREPLYLFGLRPTGTWTPAEVLALMADRAGVAADPGHRHGQDTIDPDRTLDRIDALADRLALAASRHERVLVATGHPVGLRPVHTAIVAALDRAGASVLTPGTDWHHPADAGYGWQVGTVAYTDRVAVLADHGTPRHTHSPLPMLALLAALERAGQAPPDLVVADHGWAGAAGQAGIDAVGFADCNDPALFVGEAEGTVRVSVPLDDNVAPHLYAPLTGYLLARAGLTGAVTGA